MHTCYNNDNHTIFVVGKETAPTVISLAAAVTGTIFFEYSLPWPWLRTLEGGGGMPET